MTTAAPLPRLGGDASQHVFSVLLATVAEPGLIRRLEAPASHRDVPPVALGPLALADVDLGIAGDDDGLVARLAATTGARSSGVDDADLVVLEGGPACRLDRCRRGSARAPEDGAKVFVAVRGVAPGARGVDLELAGPGVPTRRVVGIDGLEPGAVESMGRRAGPYPAGVDCWLVADDGAVAAVPRSCEIRIVTPTHRS